MLGITSVVYTGCCDTLHLPWQAVRAGLDVLICDTSGRLHTNVGLMEELAKCKRAIAKRLPGAPHEVLLVLDGTTGYFSS